MVNVIQKTGISFLIALILSLTFQVNSYAIDPEWVKQVDNIKAVIPNLDPKLTVNNYLPLTLNGKLVSDVPLAINVNNAPAPADTIKIPAGTTLNFDFNYARDANGYKKRSGMADLNSADYKITKCTAYSAGLFHWDNSKILSDPTDVQTEYMQNMTFSFPTDPTSIKFTIYAIIEYNTFDLNGTSYDHWFYAFEINQILVFDDTPPDAVYFSTPALFATTGHKISEFSKKAEAWKFKHPRNAPAKNPDNLEIWVKDNSYFNGTQAKGYKFGNTKPDMALFVETYQTYYQESDPTATGLTKLDKTLGETVKPNFSPKSTPDGNFRWIGPIWLDKLIEKGWTCTIKNAESHKAAADEPDQITDIKIENGIVLNKDKACTVFVFSGPVRGIEEAIEEMENNEDATIINPHFASLANMAFTDEQSYNDHIANSESYNIVDERRLRMVAAVSDCSGNVRLPKMNTNDPIALSAFQNPNKKYTLNKCAVFTDIIDIIPYDDILPTPVFSVTNTETNKTTVFTIPNSDVLKEENADTAKKPYFSYNDIHPEVAADVWHFSYKDDTDIMKWLKANDPKRHAEYLAALTISEDVRLIFDMVAYDNVNKNVIMKPVEARKAGQYGISTPMDGVNDKDDESIMRYESWAIGDENAPDNLKFEDVAKKIFVYPDYIFRRPEAGKSYTVSYFVEDFSPFINKAYCGVSGAPAQRHGNIRQIILEFKIEGRAVKSQNLGGTSTTHTLEAPKAGGNK